MSNNKIFFWKTFFNILLVLVCVVALNVISSNIFYRFDITEEKMFSLSEDTKNIVKNIAEQITMKFYFSESQEKVHIIFKTYGKRIKEILEAYENLSPDFLKLETFDPKPDTDEEEWGSRYGLNGADTGFGEKFFIGVVFLLEDKEIAIPFFDNRRQQYLEYDISQAILELLKLQKEKSSQIGVMEFVPVLGKRPTQLELSRGSQPTPWVAFQQLKKTFDLVQVKIDATEIDSEISTLVVMHPKDITESTQYAIEQYLLRGGDLVLLVDPMMRRDPNTALMAQYGRQPTPSSSSLPKLFPHWGIEYDASKVLGDLDRFTVVGQNTPYVMWHSLTGDSFNKEIIATKGLNDMLLVEPGGIQFKETQGLSFLPLIESSNNAGLVENTVIFQSQDPNQINKKLRVQKDQTWYLAGILSGEFRSAFTEKSKEVKDSEKDKESKYKHLAKSEKAGSVLIIADADFIVDDYSVNKSSFLNQVIVTERNQNLAFFLNMVEFLSGAQKLIGIRSRGKSRSFDFISKLEIEAQKNFQFEQEKLSVKLEDVKNKLETLQTANVSKESLTKEQINQIKAFKEEERITKKELRNIRKKLRKEIESLTLSLSLLNILGAPFIVILLGVLLLFYRSLQVGKSQSSS